MSLPTAPSNANSAVPRSFWWLDGVNVAATTGRQFVQRLQQALHVGVDGAWGPATTAALIALIARQGASDAVTNRILASLRALPTARPFPSGTHLGFDALLAGLWAAYHGPGSANPLPWSAMTGGTSAVRFASANVIPPPWAAAPPRPTVVEATQTWPQSAPVPAAPGAGGAPVGGGTSGGGGGGSSTGNTGGAPALDFPGPPAAIIEPPTETKILGLTPLQLGLAALLVGGAVGVAALAYNRSRTPTSRLRYPGSRTAHPPPAPNARAMVRGSAMPAVFPTYRDFPPVRRSLPAPRASRHVEIPTMPDHGMRRVVVPRTRRR